MFLLGFLKSQFYSSTAYILKGHILASNDCDGKHQICFETAKGARALLLSLPAAIFLTLELPQAQWAPEHLGTARHSQRASRGGKLAPGDRVCVWLLDSL